MNYFKVLNSSAEVDYELEQMRYSQNTYWRRPLYTSDTGLIKMFIEWRKTVAPDKLKIVITQNTVNIYTNEIAIIQSFVNKFEDTTVTESMKLTYAITRSDYETDVIYRANLRHKYRIYLKSKRHTVEEKKELREFLLENGAYLSASLVRWFENNHSYRAWSGGFWSWDYLYFDYDDEYLSTVMALRFGGSIRKICRIVKK
jgi:hypothetical protein